MISARAVGVTGGMTVSLLLAGMLASACSPVDRQIDAVATDSAFMSQVPETTGDDSLEVNPNPDDPFRVFGRTDLNDVDATITETPVWLVNESREPLIVTAHGGAAIVVVDTVAAADSVLVRIETRADSVELSARTFAGGSRGRTVLPMDAEPIRASFPR